jgi:hypothetical protein
VAAGEDQAQAIVGQLGLRFLVDLLGVGREPLEALENLSLRLKGPGAAQAVDRLVAGDAGDPGTGVARNPVTRPALERDDERLLDGVLGDVEVAEYANQRGDRPPRLVPEQAVNRLA